MREYLCISVFVVFEIYVFVTPMISANKVSADGAKVLAKLKLTYAGDLAGVWDQVIGNIGSRSAHVPRVLVLVVVVVVVVVVCVYLCVCVFVCAHKGWWCVCA